MKSTTIALAGLPGPVKNLRAQADRINVRDFGAFVGGGGDDTSAFRRAVDEAIGRRQARDYFGSAGPTVYAPGGCYRLSGIDVPPHVDLIGDGAASTHLILAPNANRSLLRVNAPPLTEPSSWADFAFARIGGLTLEGNSSVQSGKAHGLEIVDATYPLSQRYGAGVCLDDVRIINAFSSGLYIGRNRNAGLARNVFVEYSGGNGIESFGYDWNFFGCRSGTSQRGNGLCLQGGGAVTFHGSNFYTNSNASAVSISKYVNAYVNFFGCAFDESGESGLTMESVPDANQAHISIFGGRFLDNGAHGGSHIMLHNVPNISVVGALFARSVGAVPPQFIVEQTGVLGRVLWVANAFSGSDKMLQPFRIAPFSNPDHVTD